MSCYLVPRHCILVNLYKLILLKVNGGIGNACVVEEVVDVGDTYPQEVYYYTWGVVLFSSQAVYIS